MIKKVHALIKKIIFNITGCYGYDERNEQFTGTKEYTIKSLKK